jgi:hypothetical protein
MITYTISVCDELDIFKTSLQNITGSLNQDEKLLIQYDIVNGSTDVKNFLDNSNIEYISYSFDGDYSKMKNNLLSNVTTHWVFHLDGDEYIESGSLEINRRLVKDNNKLIDGFLCKRNDINTDTNKIEQIDGSIRLFKNRKWIKYNGIIHEGIMGCDSVIENNEYKIQHLRTEQQISASINL